jgi:hypothetical protein
MANICRLSVYEDPPVSQIKIVFQLFNQCQCASITVADCENDEYGGAYEDDELEFNTEDGDENFGDVQLWKVVGHLSVSIRPCTNLNLR